VEGGVVHLGAASCSRIVDAYCPEPTTRACPAWWVPLWHWSLLHSCLAQHDNNLLWECPIGTFSTTQPHHGSMLVNPKKYPITTDDTVPFSSFSFLDLQKELTHQHTSPNPADCIKWRTSSVCKPTKDRSIRPPTWVHKARLLCNTGV